MLRKEFIDMCIKKNIIMLFLLVFSIYLNSQKVEQKWNHNMVSYKDELLTLNILNNFDGDITFDFTNHSNDSLYLFDSYLDKEHSIVKEDLYNYKYLHRYDLKLNECKLSFLPLLPFLSFDYTDIIVTGENKLIRKGQILYHFKLIPPQGSLRIVIPQKAFIQRNYVKEIYLKDYSKFDRTIDFKDVIHEKCQRIIIEFAIYKRINLLTSYNAFYFDEFNFNRQALSYDVLSVSVDLLK